MKEEKSKSIKPRILTREQADIEKMKMTYEQRFDLWIKLFRINKMLKQALRINP